MTRMMRTTVCQTLTVNLRKILDLPARIELAGLVRYELIFGLCLSSVRFAGVRETFRGTYGSFGS
jgi:hypothetical protein